MKQLAVAPGHLVTGVFCWQTHSPSPRDNMWAGSELRACRSSFTVRLCKFRIAKRGKRRQSFWPEAVEVGR